MRRSRIWVLLLAFAAACSPEPGLSWLDAADADQMFHKDVAASRIRLLVVCGYSCESPGVGWITYERCYRRHAATRVIDPTGDVVMSAEHQRLKRLAASVAEAYNRRAVSFLDSTGRRDCSSQEQWDELARAMGEVAERVPRHPYVTSLIAYGARRDGADFQLHVPDPVDVTDSLKARLCELLPRYGIDSIRVRVTTGDINGISREEQPFVCVGSVVAA